MNKTLIIIVGIVVVLGGGFLVYQNNSSMPSGTASEDMNTMAAVNTTVVPNDSADVQQNQAGAEKIFTVTGKNFAFDPPTLTVQKGDKVRIVFKNVGGTHDFRIDEFNVATKKIGNGEEDTVEFVADKAGSFEYYCSVGTHRQMGMKGTLIVQ